MLDEIGELPLELQPKLLRVLETGRLRRVGGPGETPSDVRVVALTLRDLRARGAAGRFRGDLYHRLCGLRAACCRRCASGRDDIPLLAEHFLARAGRRAGPARS